MTPVSHSHPGKPPSDPRLESCPWPVTSRPLRLPDMSEQVVALALAASIYPPALAAVIALGRGPHLRSRVVAFVVAALLITFASGTLMLFVLVELDAVGG